MLFWMSLAHAACIDVERAIQAAEVAVAEYRLEDAGPLILQAETGLKCSWVSAEQAARLWNATGVVAAHQDRGADAEKAFAAARRANQDLFHDDYGSRMRELWQEATPDDSETQLTFTEAVPSAHQTRIDGRVYEHPWTLSAGLHLVQVGPQAAPEFGALIDVIAGIPVKLELGILGSVPMAEPVDRPQNRDSVMSPSELHSDPDMVWKAKRRKPKPLLGLSGTAMISGTVLLGLALFIQQSSIPNAKDLAALDQARNRQLALGYTGYTVLGLGVGGTVLYIVI